ncbi:hypothetical protein CVT26_011779 [Gymnopilus dilepis]|uniref:Uncharacterized protein n=1 Tax=Gymnopilus dilepis TaxID=231916 RepID=A0A409W902_9AGAR|nr:hypothetical protein CVT26_011779 [Gymnopilus dilepis]
MGGKSQTEYPRDARSARGGQEGEQPAQPSLAVNTKASSAVGIVAEVERGVLCGRAEGGGEG